MKKRTTEVSELLELLYEPEIKQRILEIVRQSSFSNETESRMLVAGNSSLSEKIERLEQEIERKQHELDQVKNEIREKDLELMSVKSELVLLKEREPRSGAERQKLKEKNAELERQFSPFRNLYEQWSKISPDVTRKVGSIIKAGNLEQFIVSSVQYDSVLGLWDFIQGEIQGRRLSRKEADVFIRLIEEGMNSYNFIYEQPVFEVCSVTTGVPFDEDKMIRASGSKPVGYVCEMLIPGIRNGKTGKWMRKSLVTIGGDAK